MEILTHEDFWARNPAPGTRFFEIEEFSEVVFRKIDPEIDDPDDITAISFPSIDKISDDSKIIVISWGTWDANKEAIELHSEAVKSVIAEGYEHECRLGLDLVEVK